MGDCIQADIDNEGNFNGFVLRADMCKLIMFRDQGRLDAVHKLIKLNLKPGHETELCHMIVDCCAQQRTYEKFFGLMAQR